LGFFVFSARTNKRHHHHRKSFWWQEKLENAFLKGREEMERINLGSSMVNALTPEVLSARCSTPESEVIVEVDP
jgi:hypothetical protein